ncbi:MAG: transporter [Cyanobacteria bacterium RYN_339]|nr:transporter [Cyanobacteria bacterium RYN_339]
MPTTTRTVHNFYAGPATMPLPALERAKEELLDFAGTGMSVMEISHRSKPYIALQEEAEALVRELLAVPAGYKVLFLQGGASLQFSMVPMNLLNGKRGDYVVTGDWGAKALKEAKKAGSTGVLASTEATNHDRIPQAIEIKQDAAYVHLTSNETISGTQFHAFPDTGAVPLVADMSSDIMWRPTDVSRFGLIYAGAQKNLGPSGVTLVIAREDLVEAAPESLPSMLSYKVHAKNDSMYNTPPTFGVYMLRNVLAWMKDQGGLKAIEARNREKGDALYAVIDRHPDFYTGHARTDSRSYMNVTFRLPDEAREKAFLKGADERGFIGLAGHRSVGGCRASIYNACAVESAKALAAYMEEFAAKG